MNRLSVTLFTIGAIALGSVATSAPFNVTLSNEELAQLSPYARESYSEALEAVDFVRYQDAADALIEAANRAPESLELNLLAAEAAGHQARNHYGDSSREYYRTGISILERAQNLEMGGTNRARLENELARQREASSAVGARDDERMASGFRLIQTVRRERLQRAVRDSDEGAKVLLGREREAEARDEKFYETRAGEIWPQLAAPARYVAPRFNPNQFGGGGQFGFDPTFQGGAGGQFGGGDFGGGQFGGGQFGGGDPFAAGGDPFATGGDPFGGGGAGGGFGNDPFATGGGGGFGGDPFGGGGGAANPFVDYNQGGGGQK